MDNTVGTEAKVGLLAKVVKQQCGERPATAGTVLTAEMTAAAGTIGTSWMSTAVGPPESDSRKVGNSSRDHSNIQQEHQQQQQELTTRTLETSAETIGASQMPTTHEFSRKFAKKSSERRNS